MPLGEEVLRSHQTVLADSVAIGQQDLDPSTKLQTKLASAVFPADRHFHSR